MNRTIRLLCTGDLHLGRYPTRVPVGETVLTVEHVWQFSVDYAIEQKLDGIVLTGDVVDKDNRFFESFSPLRRGLERLADAGIQTFAVSGNHDYNVLPGLHDALGASGFHLLGRGGYWETAPLEIEESPVVYFVGWSYSKPTITASPLNDLELPNWDVPVIGILHGDLHQPTSKYLPLHLPDLNAIGVSAWLLGHVHKPGLWNHREGIVLYPGSPQPLSLGEQGVHGPWVVNIEPGGRVSADQIPIATLRYDACDVSLAEVETREEFRHAVVEAVEDHIDQISDEYVELDRIVLSLRYVGRTQVHRDVPTWDEEVRDEIPYKGITAAVVGSSISTRPAVNIESLAAGNDPLGVVAKLILDLESGDLEGDAAALVRDALPQLEDLHRKPAFAPLRSHSDEYRTPDGTVARDFLREQALMLLDAMYAQKIDDEA